MGPVTDGAHTSWPDPGVITVVGIGEDGWPGLGEAARTVLSSADVVLGGPRQLELVRAHAGELQPWPTDLVAAVRALPRTHAGRRVAVLASGDPMLHGVGTTLVRELGPSRVHVLPAPSSVSLACARLGWATDTTTVLSAVARPLDALRVLLHPGARILVLTTTETAGADIVTLLADAGATAEVTVLEHLGGPDERIAPADDRPHARLAVVAVDCTGVTHPLSRGPGLPEGAFTTDGVLTKREVRAITLAALAPLPGQRLWDVGAGSGSIGVEWMRTDPRCTAVAVEPRADRCALVRANADRLGVPGLELVAGSAPDALAGLASPDAVFLGGGLTTDGVVAACLDALRPGGRLVANAVTLESEAVLITWRARLGGVLRRIEISHAEPVGSFTTFRPALAVTQWQLEVHP